MKCKYYKPYMDTLRMFVDGYYQLEDCCSGGPLHILLDDDNFDIKSVHFCLDTCLDALSANPEYRALNNHYSDEAYILGILICNEYAKMTLEERAAFDSYITGSRLECTGDCENCPCHVFGEVYDHMKEAEEALE